MTKRTCSTPECTNPHYGRGWCKKHYLRAWTSGTLESQPRTLAKPTDSLDTRLRNIGWTVTDSGCWEWNGSKNAYGYGQLSIGENRPHIASRIAYAAWVETPTPGSDICHRCDNPPCINPAHLFEGSRQVNVDDMVSKKRHVNGENKTGHKLTDKEVQDLKDMKATRAFTHKEIAARFGVSSTLVSLIVNGHRRKEPTFKRAA